MAAGSLPSTVLYPGSPRGATLEGTEGVGVPLMLSHPAQGVDEDQREQGNFGVHAPPIPGRVAEEQGGHPGGPLQPGVPGPAQRQTRDSGMCKKSLPIRPLPRLHNNRLPGPGVTWQQETPQTQAHVTGAQEGTARSKEAAGCPHSYCSFIPSTKCLVFRRGSSHGLGQPVTAAG